MSQEIVQRLLDPNSRRAVPWAEEFVSTLVDRVSPELTEDWGLAVLPVLWVWAEGGSTPALVFHNQSHLGVFEPATSDRGSIPAWPLSIFEEGEHRRVRDLHDGARLLTLVSQQEKVLLGFATGLTPALYDRAKVDLLLNRIRAARGTDGFIERRYFGPIRLPKWWPRR